MFFAAGGLNYQCNFVDLWTGYKKFISSERPDLRYSSSDKDELVWKKGFGLKVAIVTFIKQHLMLYSLLYARFSDDRHFHRSQVFL